MDLLDIAAAAVVVAGAVALYVFARKTFQTPSSDAKYWLKLVFGGVGASVLMTVGLVICFFIVLGLYGELVRNKRVPPLPRQSDDFTFLNWFLWGLLGYLLLWIVVGLFSPAHTQTSVPNSTVDPDARKNRARGSP